MKSLPSWATIMLLIVGTIMLHGCTIKNEVRYIDVPYEVKVPVKCRVQKASCDFNKTTDTEVISALLECIIDMKHNQAVCQ